MEPIKNALAQAGNLVQQAAHTVVEAIRGGESEETTKDNTEQPKGKQEKNSDSGDDEKTEKNIDSKQKIFEEKQDATIQKSEITSSSGGGYQDTPKKSDAKVLATSWPDLKGKTRQEAEECIKAKGYSNIKIMKKGTCSTTEHDESRVILFVDDHDMVVEEPKVG